jgi:hypothetical protein
MALTIVVAIPAVPVASISSSSFALLRHLMTQAASPLLEQLHNQRCSSSSTCPLFLEQLQITKASSGRQANAR